MANPHDRLAAQQQPEQRVYYDANWSVPAHLAPAFEADLLRAASNTEIYAVARRIPYNPHPLVLNASVLPLHVYSPATLMTLAGFTMPPQLLGGISQPTIATMLDSAHTNAAVQPAAAPHTWEGLTPQRQGQHQEPLPPQNQMPMQSNEQENVQQPVGDVQQPLDAQQETPDAQVHVLDEVQHWLWGVPTLSSWNGTDASSLQGHAARDRAPIPALGNVAQLAQVVRYVKFDPKHRKASSAPANPALQPTLFKTYGSWFNLVWRRNAVAHNLPDEIIFSNFEDVARHTGKGELVNVIGILDKSDPLAQPNGARWWRLYLVNSLGDARSRIYVTVFCEDKEIKNETCFIAGDHQGIIIALNLKISGGKYPPGYLAITEKTTLFQPRDAVVGFGLFQQVSRAFNAR